MASNSNGYTHICESCTKLCDEAKDKVRKLEKRVYQLTIACTAAITLLGQEAAKSIAGYVSTFNQVSAPSDKAGKDPKVSYVPPYGRPPSMPWYYGQGYGSIYGYPGSGSAAVAMLDPAWENRPSVDRTPLSEGPTGGFVRGIVRTAAASDLIPLYLSAPEFNSFSWPSMSDLSVATAPAVAYGLDPFGGYRMAYLDDGYANTSINTVPAPSSLLVFAMGGMIGSRSRS